MKNILFLALVICLSYSCKPTKNLYTIETPHGNMKVKLYDSTPLHKANFEKLVGEGFYDGLLFHRIINGFMIQGGDPKSKGAEPTARLGMGGPGYLVDAEIGAYHFKGTLAAARTGGPSNPEKKSSGSQFYIVQGGPVSEQQMDAMAKQKGVTYTVEDRKRYKEMGGTIQLDNDYTVFGEVVEGLDIIDKIAKVKTQQGDRPMEDVTMKIYKSK